MRLLTCNTTKSRLQYSLSHICSPLHKFHSCPLMYVPINVRILCLQLISGSIRPPLWNCRLAPIAHSADTLGSIM